MAPHPVEAAALPPMPPAPPPTPQGEVAPPPVSCPAPASVAAIAAGPEVARPQRSRLIREAMPWLVSLCINFTGIVALSLLTIPLLMRGRMHDILALPAQALGEAVDALDADFTLPSSNTASDQSSDLAAAVSQTVTVEPPAENTEVVQVALASLQRVSSITLPSREKLDLTTAVREGPKPLTAKEPSRAGSVEEAVDGIGSQVRDYLASGDLLVVWLLDASLSLVDDRQRVADRLGEVYAGIEREQQQALAEAGKKKGQPILTNAVVAYGAGAVEVVSPSKYSGRTIAAIREIPIEPTGLENVMAAVSHCVAKYPSTFKRQTMLVIWTDESGDDTGLLEPTIALCRRENVRVSVIGPTAVLGAQEGTHIWVHETGQRFYLPVTKGPETALPERLRWPYWWPTSLPSWASGQIATRDDFQGWYGGPQMAALSSGFPPYALTRLARQTGGTMTIFDREIDRGPFSLDQMRRYTPDYRSAAEIIDELRYYPLRAAVLKSVDTTRAATHPPSSPVNYMYVTPASMRRSLRKLNDDLEDPAKALEMALAPWGRGELEYQYDSEPSPRWRAWYNLTYGRLLAQSVRYAEARALFQLLSVPDAIPEEANCLSFAPAARLISGAETLERSREAERLLNRCLEENPQTPWAYLAQRELDYPLGLAHAAFFKAPPPPPPAPITVGPAMPMRNAAPIVPPRL